MRAGAFGCRPSANGMRLLDGTLRFQIRAHVVPDTPNPSRGLRNQTLMTVLDFLRQQFKYDSWANREELRVLSSLPTPPDQATRLLTHIIAAQWLWFDRIQKNPQRTAVWPETDLAGCAAQLKDLEAAWQSYLASLSEADLSKPCSYTNSNGEPWTSSVLEILNQLILHAAHHRGQISLLIRDTGSVPGAVDYIFAVRKGLLA